MELASARTRVKEVLELVIDELSRHSEVVLEAYPGFGKTLLGIELLKRFHRGILVVRTVTEMSVAMSMAKSLGLGLRPIYGRMRICPNPPCSDPRLFPVLCKARRVVGECIERFDSEAVSACSKVFSAEEIKELSASLGACLFRAHVLSSLRAGKIVTTYEFLDHHPEVVEKVSTWDVAILDECHAVIEDAEKLVVKIDRAFVYELAESLKRVDPRACYALRGLYRKWGDPNDVLYALEKVVDSCGDRCLELEEVLDWWRKGFAYIDRSSGTIYVAREPRLSIARARLFSTAYIPPPLAKGRKVIRIDNPPIRVRVVIDASVTTRFKERGEDLVPRLARVVASYIDKGVANLVVAPSKAIAEELAKELALMGFRIAPPEAIERVSSGTVIVDVAGGRATEGVTPSRDLRKVIVAGMPFPPPSPELNALSKLFGFDATYTYKALLRTVQAVGRLMRWGGEAVLIDRRFVSYRHMLPKWMIVEGVS